MSRDDIFTKSCSHTEASGFRRRARPEARDRAVLTPEAAGIEESARGVVGLSPGRKSRSCGQLSRPGEMMPCGIKNDVCPHIGNTLKNGVECEAFYLIQEGELKLGFRVSGFQG